MDKPSFDEESASPVSDTPADLPPDPPSRRPLQMVAIGASAGGLESLERFFDGLATMRSTAFVVIQHLSPNYKTMMDHLLSRHTSMSVAIATDGVAVEPDHVYVIPPKKEMLVRNGRLHLLDKTPGEIPHLPIDKFFQSMAVEYGADCAAIVLSGTGSDGSKGIYAVRTSGGLVFSESETTAKFTGMPHSAFQTGCVHHVLPPESMGEHLEKYVAGESMYHGSSQHESAELGKVFELLRKECQIDFRSYKPSTVARRIDRRIALCKLEDLSQYIKLIRADREELRRLYEDMLIGVTKFFRDETCFEHVETEILPNLFTDAKSDRPIRIWVVGCATGEEAYTLAILMDEFRQISGNPTTEFKILATDVHPSSLTHASAGVYSADTVSNVSSERLAKYFDQRDGVYVVKPEIRRQVMFTPHNVLQDHPFTDLDMVTCRNLLIYFDSEAQRRAMTLFHFGLRKHGYLFLGPSETVGELRRDFHPVNERCKTYVKQREARLPDDVKLPLYLGTKTGGDWAQPDSGRYGEAVSKLNTYDRLLNTTMPPTLLVDGSRKVIESFGGAEKLLQIPARTFSNDLIDVAPADLKSPLSAVFRRVQKNGRTVHFPATGIKLERQGVCNIDIQATPLEGRSGDSELYAFRLTIKPQTEASQFPIPSSIDELDTDGSHKELVARLRELEDELTHTKEDLQSTIEELESSNEELQATNEELISSNEELQSTNEELNSVNEELHTVNVEYQNQNADLRELNEDMNHLFASTDIGVVFLDRNLAIRRFTPRIASIFNLEERDVGRELASFSHSLKLEHLHRLIRDVLGGAEPVKQEVEDHAGNHYFLRILPYVVESQFEGVIMTLTEIGPLVKARRMAAKYQRRLQRAIDAVPVFVSYCTRDQRYAYANQAYQQLISVGDEGVIGKSIREILGPDRYEQTRPRIEGVLAGKPQVFEQELQGKQGRLILSVTYLPNRSKSGKVLGFYVSAADVTKLKIVEEELEETAKMAKAANEAKSDFLAKMSHEIRSPMTAILGFADILEGQLNQPDDRECVDVIRRNGLHLLDLINDILDLSRVESGRLELEERSFVPSDLMRECFNAVIPNADSANAELQIHLGDDLDQPMVADRRRLRQVVLNLLTNAIKFCEQGTVELTAFRADRQLCISVRDTGCGIPENYLTQVFEPFIQADNSDTRKFEGTGLGLAITKQLVDHMGGSISLDSEVGTGSQFSVSLPWRAGKDSDVEESAIELLSQTPRLENRMILLIDDRRDMRFLAEHLLRDAGAEVRTAASGQEGIDLLRQMSEDQMRPDCIVTDIQMPGMDGYETTQKLRASGYQQPILALTASAMKQEREKCLAAGCDGHMAKPINKSAFVRTIAELIAGKEQPHA